MIECRKLNEHLTETKIIVQDKDFKIQDMETQMKNDKESWIRNMNDIEQEGRISNELASLGSQCRGERHAQIIDAQKTALSEMRQKMKIMEVTKIPSKI